MIWNRFLLIATTAYVINIIQANMRDFKMSIFDGKRHSCLNTSCSSIYNETVKNILQCQTNCLADERCLAVNYHKATKRCELFLNLPSEPLIADQYATAMIVASGTRTLAGKSIHCYIWMNNENNRGSFSFWSCPSLIVLYEVQFWMKTRLKVIEEKKHSREK